MADMPNLLTAYKTVHLHNFKRNKEHVGKIQACITGNVVLYVYVTTKNVRSQHKGHEINA
jgi:hypothetical protein